ncbi:hypothetical protein ACJ72_00394 [Emergomyces africanus]|uniref:Enoyl reductase (ER) domain-containing protein n=1 Tax=Emergomyces africanus TaxID=1955775 RepID=A0A1B7P880_9EURO|nr:hypothetical protein ACJ72_00394 [Emergomyces africanus]
MDQTPRTHTTLLAEQENIPSSIPALYLPLLPSHPYTTTNPPPPSTLLYTPNHPTPTPTESQYLLKIQTTALCRGELGWAEILSPSPTSTEHNKNPPAQPNGVLKRIPGHDISGVILSTPRTDEHSITGPKFKVGDEVIGLLAFERDGGAADVAVAVDGELAFKPKNVSAVEAACLPLSGLTAWQAIFEGAGMKGWVGYTSSSSSDGEADEEEKKKKKEEEEEEEEEEWKREWEKEKERVKRVLVLNASGGVGVMLGVDEVLDYTKEKEGLGEAFRKRGWEPVDFVVDCIGGQTLKQAHDATVIRDGGVVVSVAQPVPESEPEWEGVRDAIAKRGLTSRFFIVRPDGKQLEKIALLVEKGELRAFVEKEMELYQGREAMELVESGRVRGKVVLRVNYYSR